MRTVTISIGTAVVAAGLGCGVATAGPVTPASTTNVLAGTPAVGIVGDPYPVGNFVVDAAPAVDPGMTTFRTLRMCNTLVPSSCSTFVAAVDVHWLNTSTGAFGDAAIPSGNWAATDIPPPQAQARTGTGRVVYAVTVRLGTLLPGFGAADVG